MRWRLRRRFLQLKRALRRLSRRFWAEKVSTVPRVTEVGAWANLSITAAGDNDNQYWQVDLPEHWQILAVRVLHPTSHTLSIEVDWDVEIGRGRRQAKTARRTIFIPGDWTVGDTAEVVGQRVRVLVKPLIVAAEPAPADETPPRPLRAQRAASERAKGSSEVEVSDIDFRQSVDSEDFTIDDEHRDTNIS